MENRSVSFGVTGIGLVVAVVALAFRGTPAPQSVASEPAALAVARPADGDYRSPEEAVAGYDRGRRLIAEYLGGTWSSLTAAPDTRPPRRLSRRLPLRVTIATIPDPYDSHLDWSYDANLEALRRAMGTAGFVPQNFWLPARSDSIRVTVDGVTARRAAHDYQPGVFLFRSTNVDAPALHLVYLVPELPTAGVHMMAFRAALAERKTIMGADSGPFAIDRRERAELSVLGPNFSGSALSLRALVEGGIAARTDTVPPFTARIVTGSATAFANLRILSDPYCLLVPDRGDSLAPPLQTARIRFSSTVNPDEALDDVLRQVVDAMELKPYQVAVLTESGTAYGAARPGSAAAPTDSTRGVATTDCTPVEANALYTDLVGVLGRASDSVETTRSDSLAQQVTNDSVALPEGAYLTVPFPLNIASLRSAFARAPTNNEGTTSLPALGEAPRTRLSLEDMSRSRESPPLTSGLSTPSLDVVLAGLINTLNEHDVRVVVIKATDVRDKLMLAQEVRRGVRDVLLVVYEGHVLLRRPEFAAALRGALVLSSYPMALENQFWSTAERLGQEDSSRVRLSDVLAFPTDAAVGTYNAALTLLGMEERRVEFALRNPNPPSDTATYPFPPVWLSVIGRDGFYPIRADVPDSAWQAYLGVRPDIAKSDSTRARRPHEHSYMHDRLSLSIIIIVPALLISALLVMFLVGRDGLSRIGMILPDSLARPKTATESLYLALFVLSLSATYLPFSVALDARRIVGSVDAYTGGRSVAMSIVLWLFGLVVSTGIALLVNGVWGLVAGPAERQGGRTRPRGGHGTPASAPATEDPGDEDAPPAATRTLRGRVGDYLAPMRAASQIAAIVPSLAVGDDLDEYLRQSTRHEAPGVEWTGLVTIIAASVVFVAASLVYTCHLLELSRSGGIEATLSMYRALHLTSGVSPLLPLVLLGGGFAIWTWWQLQQSRQFNHPDHFEGGVRRLAHHVQAVALWRRSYRAMVDARRGLNWMAPGLGVVWIILAISMVAWLIDRSRLPSLEALADATSRSDLWFDRALWLGLLSLLVSSSWAIYRLVFSWNGLERFLDILAGTPLSSAFGRLPLDVAQLTNLGFLGFRRDDRYDDRYAMELWVRARADTDAAIDAAEAGAVSLVEPLRQLPTGDRGTESVRGALDVLRTSWEVARTRPDPVKEQPLEPAGLGPTAVRALRSLEEYAACEVVLYVEQYLINLRRLCFFLFASLLILVTVSAQYPYQPHSVVSLASIVLLGFTVVSVFYTMVRMSRNVTLSRIARTEPGKVTWDTTLVLNMVTFGIVPLLALATSEFPAVRAFLFSWADPLVRAVART